MPDLNSLCITCLSIVEDGANISAPMLEFLRKDLRFKCKLEDRTSKLVCRKCYKTLIDVQSFCSQLRHVEQYFASQAKAQGITDDDLIEEVAEIEEVGEIDEVADIEETAEDEYLDDTENVGVVEEVVEVVDLENEFAMEYNATFDDEVQISDPILTEGELVMNVDYHVVESSVPPPNMLPKAIVKSKPMKSSSPDQVTQKQHMKPLEKRFVCLICSKLFSSITELRSHESTHTKSAKPDVIPVFRGVRIARRRSCPQCGEHFDLLKDLTSHIKHHELEKIRPFPCSKCNRRFVTADEVRDHLLVHSANVFQTCQCEICGKKYLNESTLEAHKRITHSSSDDSATAEATSIIIEE